MYRTLNRLRWTMFAFIWRWDFLWTLTCFIAVNVIPPALFANQLHEIRLDHNQRTETWNYFPFLGIFIWFPSFHWYLFDFITRAARRNSNEWVIPGRFFFHIGASLGITLLLSSIYSMIWTAIPIRFLASFPLFFSGLLLIQILSEVSILPSVSRWIRNTAPHVPMILTFSTIPLIFEDTRNHAFDQFIKGQHVAALWLLWLVPAILVLLFVKIASMKREYIQLTISDNRGWKQRNDSKTAANSEPAWWKNWVNRQFDRRMERYLASVRSNGISNMAFHWRIGNRILWFSGLFYMLFTLIFLAGPPIVFPSVNEDEFHLSRVLAPIYLGITCSIFLVPIAIASDWKRRRRVMELEILRPVRTVDFQLQIVAAFLRDIVPSIPIAGVGLFGLWTLAESAAERSQLAWFALMWIPTILVFVVAVTAALALFDDIGIQFLIGIFAFISGGFALFSYGLVVWAPGISFAISAIYFVISVGWIQQLYRVWEDMELGRRNSVEFD